MRARKEGADRRFLPRANPGRRVTDAEQTGLFGASEEPRVNPGGTDPLIHLVILVAGFVAGLSLIWLGNSHFAALLFNKPAVAEVAKTLASGANYATFDLNIESRALRRAHIANLTKTPDVAVLGASHWQEAHAGLVPEKSFYNAHVHRDYYQDVLAVTEMFVRNNHLPKQLIITIRDNLFTPVDERTDFLWKPAMSDYRDMAGRLGVPAPSWSDMFPLPQLREGISLENLRMNVARWRKAPVLPHVTTAEKHDTLDILLSDGSIQWSRDHDALFTAAYARERALEFAAQRRDDPPRIDPQGVAAFERLLAFLRDRGVEVFLAHPPFNPIYYDAVQDSPYMEGLARVEALTREIAEKYGLEIIGSFDPYEMNCRAEMYIDAEHSNPQCLYKVLSQYRALDWAGHVSGNRAD